jgi:hypothetical protein
VARREEIVTLSPRNFTLPFEERVRALTAGPLAYMRRLRRIEDLKATLERTVGEHWANARKLGRDPHAYLEECGTLNEVALVNELIARHNRYYPTEANLAMNPRTDELVDRAGQPWRPMRAVALDEVLRPAQVR